MVKLIEIADAFYVDQDYVSNELHFYRAAAVGYVLNFY